MGKIKHKKTTVDNITFDSKTEANYYEYRRDNKEKLNIKEIELQPQFILQEKHLVINNQVIVPKDEKELKSIEKMTDSDWFKYWELSKSQIKKSKVEHSSDKKCYKVIVTTPNDDDNSKLDYCCYIKDKSTGKIYCFEYSNNFIKEYDTIKSIKLI